MIIIIGVLAGIAIPLFLRERKQGYAASMKSDSHDVATAEESYRTEQGSYAIVTTTKGVAAIAGDSVRLSPGNAVSTTSHDSTGYGLEITNPKATSTTLYYDSTRGGLQPATATACLTTYATTG